jgi:dipeptidyl aminopeptidase/acylaminoacyl peptidase
MLEKRVRAYGTWDSPITPELVTSASIGLSELAVDDEAVLWLESRAAERGRRALVRWTPRTGAVDAVPLDADVATGVHEYGGGAFAVRNGTIVYSERSDGSVRLIDGVRPARLVTSVDGCRYAGFSIDPIRGLIYAVREDHRDRAPTAPLNALVALSLDANADPRTNEGRIIHDGTDFVLAPQLSCDGTQLAWISWNQPDMPWDAGRLFVASVTPNGALTNVRCIAGSDGGDAIAEAHWMSDGTLLFTSDRTGWWNVYAWRDERIEALAPMDAEFGQPHWVFGRRMLAEAEAGHILCAFIRDGVMCPGLIEDGAVRELRLGPVDGTPLAYAKRGVVYVSARSDGPPAVCISDHAEVTVLRAASEHAIDAAGISIGEAATAPTSDGELVHYTFYPPRNAAWTGPPGDRPPLIVMSHGGPTSMSTPAFNLSVQWWTSRGFAVAHVNYRGSSGFGRAYRNRLFEAWGVVDVADCVSVARRLGENGDVDASRIAIRGGSSSGMTALLAVATSDVFRAAASLYGVMELESLAAETHKFEARYTDRLVGPLPETRQRYLDRSPVNHVATIDVPVMLFQGLDDRTVPPSQATAMRDALEARGIPVIYQAFEGEGHGFRKAETVQRVLEMELAFYRDVFGLTP